jgi:hypothetical protein
MGWFSRILYTTDGKKENAAEKEYKGVNIPLDEGKEKGKSPKAEGKKSK